MERRIVIEHRDALNYMLREAAEIEHAICCQYLFAAFSLKRSVDEGLEPRQLRLVENWRTTILEIAAQEMMHLALVNNLLSAIGGAPCLSRPNLPQQGRRYPPGVQFSLVPFSEKGLRHYLYLERPEGITRTDVDLFETLREAEPILSPEDIVPRPQDFATVGELYHSIEDGFRNLVNRHGEEWVFIGDRSAQARPETFMWPELVVVHDLETACRAISEIVEQGEGPRGHWQEAHYGRLLVILGELLTEKKRDPSFEPTRPVMAANSRHPVDAPEGPLISDPHTAQLMDAFNVGYEVLLHCLARYFMHGHEDEDQLETLAGVAVNLMIRVISPVGQALTNLPVGEEYPGRTVGPSFELFYSSGFVLPHTWQAWVVIHERLAELDMFLERVLRDDRELSEELKGVRPAIATMRAALEEKMPRIAEREIKPPGAWLAPSAPDGVND
jgi:Ferritin-like